ncbi:PIN domain-like protein [Mycena vitilis]|nr:PIN domain-like protein [Mycena vitilis]
MGNHPFWTTVKPAAQTASFKEVTIKEGFVEKRRETGTIIVGVDGCLWLTQCQAVFHKPRHAQAGKNPELKALFYKLAALNEIGLDAVIVFDGKHGPDVKRGKQVRKKLHWLIAEFVKLIDLFGFHSHMAPGEADAELACLDKFGFIDGILTDDGDVATFGVRRIFRRFNKDHKDKITVYTSEAMQSHPDVGLTQGGIFLLAILGGGDYDMAGLVGCGPHIAHALACCGFGDSLLAACQNMVEADLKLFLVRWREDLRLELATNLRGFLRSRQPNLSTKIPEAFPSLRVLKLYIQPVTRDWVVKLPELPELAMYCHREFGWNASTILDKFKRLIFPGLFTRRLAMPLNIDERIRKHVVEGRISEEHPPLSAFLQVLRVSKPTAETSKKYQVKIATGGLSQLMLSRLRAAKSASGSPSATTTEWIAAPLIESHFPRMVNAFNKALNLPLLAIVPPVKPVLFPARLNSAEIPANPKDQPATKKWLGMVDLTDDKGEGGSGMSRDGNVIDLTMELDSSTVELMDYDSDIEIID